LLFKIYADIDVWILKLMLKPLDEFVNIVKALEPTLGHKSEDIPCQPNPLLETEPALKAE